MKKFFTLIAAACMAASVSAQDWVCGNQYILNGTALVDNDYATATTANNDQFTTELLDEDGIAAPVTYFDKTFTHYLGVRTTTAPSASEPTGTAHESNVALVVAAKQNTDMTLYYKIGSTKTLNCYDQTAGEALSVEQTESNPGEDYLYCTGVYKFQEGHTYTVYITGGTLQLHGIAFGEGTYVEPASKFYSNAAASVNAEGFSTMAYGDGVSISLTGNAAKSYAKGSSITIDGAKYTGTKVSNGAQNTFYAPEGKKVYVFTLYSYINAAADGTNSYWKEVGGVTYEPTEDNVMEAYQSGATPDVRTYVFPEGADVINFTNSGKQLVFVIEANYDPTGVAGVSAAESAASAEAKTVVKDGRIVIVKGDAEYSVSGAQLK